MRLVGRAKDLIITGGLNVYPKEIEERIDALPGVVESAVIGVPDPDFGEAVTAVVVANPGMRIDEADDHRRAEGGDGELQGAEARTRGRRAAAQRDGQGPEERVARALQLEMGSELFFADGIPDAGIMSRKTTPTPIYSIR